MSISITISKAIELDELHNCITETVNTSYPAFYPKEAIDFFLKYLNKKDLLKDRLNSHIFTLNENDKIVGTATLKDRHVKRVFIHPSCQGKGYGKILMGYVEKKALEAGCPFVELHSSLFAKRFYDSLHYKTFKTGAIPVKNRQALLYHRMGKTLSSNHITPAFNLDGKKYTFSTRQLFSQNGHHLVDLDVYQQGNLVHALYTGKQVKSGELFGVIENLAINCYYKHWDNHGNSLKGRLTFSVNIHNNGEDVLLSVNTD